MVGIDQHGHFIKLHQMVRNSDFRIIANPIHGNLLFKFNHHIYSRGVPFHQVQPHQEGGGVLLQVSWLRGHGTCLRFLKSEVGTRLITFQDKYYLYKGDKSFEEEVLTIGWCESAWLAKICLSLLETVDSFLWHLHRWQPSSLPSAIDMNYWLVSFQLLVNTQTSNDSLWFTAEVWKPNNTKGKIHKTTFAIDDHFPSLVWNSFGMVTLNSPAEWGQFCEAVVDTIVKRKMVQI